MKNITKCDKCGQSMTLYRRNIRIQSIQLLRKLYFEFVHQTVKVSDLSNETHMVVDFTKLRYWGLIRSEGNNKYSITELGIAFILGRAHILKYKFVYNNIVQPNPEDELNPLIQVWDIKPEVISRETVLRDAKKYPHKPEEVLFT